MSMQAWLWTIQVETVVVFLVCLAGNIRAMNFVGRIARKKNRPISKSTVIGLNILLIGAFAAMVLSLRGQPPIDTGNALLSILRHMLWASMALKTIITEELIIRRPERLFRPDEQQRIAERIGITRHQVDETLREFLR